MSFRRHSFLSRHRAPIIVCTGALLTGLISFFVTVKIYESAVDINLENKVPNKVVTNLSGDNILAKVEEDNIKVNEEKTKTEIISEGGKTVAEEFKNEEINVIEIDEDEYNEFINILAQNDVKESEIIETTAIVQKESGEKLEKLSFIRPLSGETGLGYATEKLIYSNTLEEWITHNGIDIISEEAEPVKAIESGTIESVKMDPRYGNTIIIKHNEEYKSVYSNLSTTDLVYVGKKVEKGEIISGVGKGFGFESEEKPHVHLTILKNGESINPEDVI